MRTVYHAIVDQMKYDLRRWLGRQTLVVRIGRQWTTEKLIDERCWRSETPGQWDCPTPVSAAWTKTMVFLWCLLP